MDDERIILDALKRKLLKSKINISTEPYHEGSLVIRRNNSSTISTIIFISVIQEDIQLRIYNNNIGFKEINICLGDPKYIEKVLDIVKSF